MLEEDSPGMNHSKSSQTSSCCIFLYKGIDTTSGSGYCKAVNSCTLEKCIRNITTCVPRSLHFPPGICLLAFTPYNAKWIGLLFLQEQRAEEQLLDQSNLLWWITMSRCTGRSKSRINTPDDNLHSPFLFSPLKPEIISVYFFRRNLKMKCQRFQKHGVYFYAAFRLVADNVP